MKRFPVIILLPFIVALAASCPSVIRAAETTATIEGRVVNPANGEYLERARVTVEGTALETFTDTAGFYRLNGVPAGTARVHAFYTGLLPQSNAVTLSSGQTATLDFNLSMQPGSGRAGEVVKLAEFLVSTSREMESSAIAINEQRFASNIKSVVSTDEFGNIAEGAVGEFVKFLPGVTIEYQAGALARGISVNGVPSDYVPITVNGFDLASAGGNSVTARTSQMDMTSITSTSRIEVSYSPTPESQGAALAGSINMVPRSAFERSRPEFKTNVYLTMRDSAKQFHKTPGPFDEKTWKIQPGFDFSYIRPVTKNFGFTLSGGKSENGTKEEFIQNVWRGVASATNGTTFPDTTPNQPYLTQTQVREGTKRANRMSFGATADWRFTPNDRLSFSYQHYFIDFLVLNHTIQYTLNAVAPGFTPFSVRSTPGQGNLQLAATYRDRTNSTLSPSLVWRHDGPVWKLESGIGYSRGRNTFRAIDKGYFSDSVAQRSGVTIAFDDIFYLRPNRITVTDAAGAPVDPYNINTYAMTSATSNPDTNYDEHRGWQASAQRDLHAAVPITIKTGVDFRHNQRDQKQATVSYSFVGADGRASTTPIGNDDGAARFFAPIYSEREMPFGFPKVQWYDNTRLWSNYKANPTQMTVNPSAEYTAFTNNSKYAEELVSAAYVRSDVQLIDRRLKLTAGVRAEQTNVEAQGPLNDRTRNYRRDASGKIILVNGSPQLIYTNTGSLEYVQLTQLDRGATAEKEYLRWFPSLNATFNIRENFLARAALYQSIGRPNFNQYAGGLTLPDEALAPSVTNRITVNNAAIKPWSAKTVSGRLEYYFEGVGMVAFGAYRREFENFFGSTTFQPTSDFLTLYGLDPGIYSKYDVATQFNLAETVKMTGVDVSYKQALTFLPHWARGVNVFANGAAQRTQGPAASNFQGYIPRKASWGFALVRESYNFRMNWSYQSRNRLGEVTGRSIPAGTFNFQSKSGYLDIVAEYYLTKKIGLYLSLRNVGDTPDQREVDGPGIAEHAQFRSRELAGSLWTFGVKGTF